MLCLMKIPEATQWGQDEPSGRDVDKVDYMFSSVCSAVIAASLNS